MDIDWSKAPEGFDFYIVDKSGEQTPGFHMLKGCKYFDDCGFWWSKDSKSIIVHKRPAKTEWDGSGYPPIGYECEVQYIVFSTQEIIWKPHVVVGHDDGKVVFKVRDGKYDAIELDKVRPLRNKEKKREKVISEALNRVSSPRHYDVHPRHYLICALETLYDSGLLRDKDD